MERAPENSSGQKIYEDCGTLIEGKIKFETKNGPMERRAFDIAHWLTLESRVDEWKKQEIPSSRKEVIDDFNDIVKLRALCPPCNQGHKTENIPGEFRTGINRMNQPESLVDEGKR